MKFLQILISITLMSILVSCGNKVIEPITQSGSNEIKQETPVVLTTEEEEIITELLKEIEEVLEVEEEIATIDVTTSNFSGNGTEPFWGFNASGSTLVLREPSDTGPMDTTNFSGVVITSSGTSVNMTASGMTLDLILGACSDGMSDLNYDYSSIFTAGIINYTGCANVN